MNDESLARLIREAADQVQPTHALDAIRARTVTSPKESAMSIARTWIFGGLGGAVATGAVIGGVYFVTTNGDHDPVTPGPADTPSHSASPTPTDSVSTSPSQTPAASQKFAAAVYWAGDTPSGERLYREFQRIELSPGEPAHGVNAKLGAAVTAALSGMPLDRDYRRLWLEGTGATATYNGDVVTIDVHTPDKAGWDAHGLQHGMTAEDGRLAVQQLIYTAQAALGQGRVPVQFLLNGDRTTTILGQPASEPLSADPVLETLSHVNISTPAEGDEVTGDTLEVTGVANSFEANVVVKLQRFEGTFVAFQKPLTADGWMGDKLFPFTGSFDISKVEPGKYTLTVTTDDPSGGAEGNGAYTDSKVITIT
jgi:hypothetical protein